jgi:hypothetical protein
VKRSKIEARKDSHKHTFTENNGQSPTNSFPDSVMFRKAKVKEVLKLGGST